MANDTRYGLLLTPLDVAVMRDLLRRRLNDLEAEERATGKRSKMIEHVRRLDERVTTLIGRVR